MLYEEFALAVLTGAVTSAADVCGVAVAGLVGDPAAAPGAGTTEAGAGAATELGAGIAAELGVDAGAELGVDAGAELGVDTGAELGGGTGAERCMGLATVRSSVRGGAAAGSSARADSADEDVQTSMIRSVSTLRGDTKRSFSRTGGTRAFEQDVTSVAPCTHPKQSYACRHEMVLRDGSRSRKKTPTRVVRADRCALHNHKYVAAL